MDILINEKKWRFEKRQLLNTNGHFYFEISHFEWEIARFCSRLSRKTGNERKIRLRISGQDVVRVNSILRSISTWGRIKTWPRNLILLIFKNVSQLFNHFFISQWLWSYYKSGDSKKWIFWRNGCPKKWIFSKISFSEMDIWKWILKKVDKMINWWKFSKNGYFFGYS